MRLRILFFPLSLVVSIVGTIFYIKPQIDKLLVLHDKYRVVVADQKTAQMQAANVPVLIGSINQDGASQEQLMARYLPVAPDSDVITDTINFIANQTGVSVSKLDMTSRAPVVPVAAPPASVIENNGLITPADADSLVTDTLKEVIPFVSQGAVSVDFSIIGFYPNLWDFLNRLARTNRAISVRQDTIVLPQETLADAAKNAGQPQPLVLSVRADFAYLPMITHPKNASVDPTKDTFASATLDTSAIQRTQDFMSKAGSPVPPLSVTANGRMNPFSL